MADVYKVLGQTNPGAGYTADLYRAPAYAGTVVSTLTVCNLGSNSTTFSIAVRPAGISVSARHYINYNTIISANDTIALTIGITLAQTDVVTVSSASGAVSFTAFGSETGTLPLVIAPVINSVVTTDSAFASYYTSGVSVDGGYIKVLGSNFSLLSQVFVAGSAATVTTYVSSSELWAQVPPRSPNTYSLMIFNGTNGAGTVYPAGIVYTSGVPSSSPVWTGSGTVILVNGSVQLSATGASTLSYAVTSGSLPVNTTLSTTGLISSTGAPGNYSFTVTATDAQSRSTAQAITLYVPLQLSWSYNADSSIGNILSNSAYSFGPLAYASYGSLSYAVTGGSLPGGLSLNTGTGVISGSATAGPGLLTSTFTLTATSTLFGFTSSHTSRSFNITVTDANVTWAYASGATIATINNPPIATVPLATVDYGTATFALASGSLPSGVSLNTSTGVISGTPTSSANNTTYNFTISITPQSSGVASSRAFSIAVATATVDVLVVAGGAGGGVDNGGGGGAGGIVYSTALSINYGAQYTVSVGSGGAGALASYGTGSGVTAGKPGDNGQNSAFGGAGITTVTALGGGGGATGQGNTNGFVGGVSGGSGGGGQGENSGAYANAGTGLQPTSASGGYGNLGGVGGDGTGTNQSGGGGGGGAGTAGGAGGATLGGLGGAGIVNPMTGSTAGELVSTSYYLAGGGGGGNDNSSTTTVRAGGSGGGGDSNNGSGTGVAGLANTGGGGGGTGGSGHVSGAGGPAGAGGSGVVVLRYSTVYNAAASTTGVAAGFPIIASGYRIYQFNSSGSITF